MELTETVHVPVQAVFTENDEHFVFRKEKLDLERHLVVIGQHNDEFIEIKKGLQENDIVALSMPENYEAEVQADKGKSKAKKKKKA